MILPTLLLAGMVVSVHDGDTLRLADNTRIRLAYVDANEMNGTCHRVCARHSAAESRAWLSVLVAGRWITYEPVGRSYKRIVARVWVDGVDVSCLALKGGWAVYVPSFDKRWVLRGCLP